MVADQPRPGDLGIMLEEPSICELCGHPQPPNVSLHTVICIELRDLRERVARLEGKRA